MGKRRKTSYTSLSLSFVSDLGTPRSGALGSLGVPRSPAPRVPLHKRDYVSPGTVLPPEDVMKEY